MYVLGSGAAADVASLDEPNAFDADMHTLSADTLRLPMVVKKKDVRRPLARVYGTLVKWQGGCQKYHHTVRSGSF